MSSPPAVIAKQKQIHYSLYCPNKSGVEIIISDLQEKADTSQFGNTKQTSIHGGTLSVTEMDGGWISPRLILDNYDLKLMKF